MLWESRTECMPSPDTEAACTHVGRQGTVQTRPRRRTWHALGIPIDRTTVHLAPPCLPAFPHLRRPVPSPYPQHGTYLAPRKDKTRPLLPTAMPGFSQADASPALSDDGQSFQDAADGSSPTPSLPPELEGEDLPATDQGAERAGESEKPSIEPAPQAKEPVGEGKAERTGVAALRANFQNGSTKGETKTLASKGREGRRAPKASGGKESRGDKTKEKTAVTGGGEGTSAQTEEVEGSSMALANAAEKMDEAEKKLSPSKGAQSLLDPSETIKNPFGGGIATPSLDSPAETTQAAGAAYSDETELKRFSATSSRQETELEPGTPTPSQVNRFSTVSLSTTAPFESKRDTISASNPVTDSRSSLYTPAEFLARQNARLSRVEGDGRASFDGGAEKIKERVKELRYGHSRDNSSSSAKEASSEAAPDQGPNTTGLTKGEGESYDDDASALGTEAIDWDFWGNVMSNYQEIARTHPQQLSRAIQAGIPGALRGMMWQLMSSSKDEEMEIIYAFYLKQPSPHEKMIRKDLARTFPGQDYFQDGKGIGQENLFNVVKAYSLYDEECGYCQGMQFVVGPLLLNMPDEEAFSTLVRLMKSYDLRGHFVPNMPALQLRLYQFDRLLEEMLPLLHRHLVRSGVKSSMYASGWFMTCECQTRRVRPTTLLMDCSWHVCDDGDCSVVSLRRLTRSLPSLMPSLPHSSYRSPLDICFRILDSVFAEGIEALFRFALALMKRNEEELLSMSFEEAVPLLAARVFDVYKSSEGEIEEVAQGEGSGGANVGSGYRVNDFVREAFEMQITPFMLDSFANDFAEQVRVATSHRREIDALKIQNKNLQAKVKSLEDQMGAVQQEHVDLVKSVVMAKLAKEEMAEEVSGQRVACKSWSTRLFWQSTRSWSGTSSCTQRLRC